MTQFGWNTEIRDFALAFASRGPGAEEGGKTVDESGEGKDDYDVPYTYSF